jgi:hypothetical protein
MGGDLESLQILGRESVVVHVFAPRIYRYLLLLPLLHASACGKQEFHASTPEGQTPILEADAAVSPLDGRVSPMPTPVGMDPGTTMGLFPAALVRTDTLRFTIDTQDVRTEFELKDIYQEQREIFRQVTRENRMERFQQGHPPLEKKEVFDQVAKKGPVDILLVIDNSISMTEEQRNLSDKMYDLVASLGNSDWQIGIITTTATLVNGEPQCQLNVIRSTEADAAERFRSSVLAGISGDSNEQGILQAVVGLSCASRPWLRPHANLAVLFVTDEDNCSDDGKDCRGSVAENENYLIQYVEQTLGMEVGKNAGFYGIFSPPADPCRTSPNIAHQYQRLVNYKANGMINHGNICDASYKATLNRISENIAVLLGSQFELKEQPLAGSLKVKLMLGQGQERVLEPGDYVLDQKTITFAAGLEPPAGAHLQAEYLIPGVPLWKTLTLAERPAPGTLEVKFNDAPVDEQLYQWNDRTLEFRDSPPADAMVRITYAKDKALHKKFSLSRPAEKDSLEVRVNGQVNQTWRLDERGQDISFDPAPGFDAEISLRWTWLVGPQLSYALPLGADSSDHQILDGTWPVPFTESEGVFTIPAAVHRAGKTLTLRYQMPDARLRRFPLAHRPIPESVQMEVGASHCQFGAELELQDAELISTCGVKSRTEFVLNYQYYEPQDSFTLNGVRNPEVGQWKVFINGVETQEYVRQGSSFTFPGPLAPDAEIGLQYSLPTGQTGPSGS